MVISGYTGDGSAGDGLGRIDFYFGYVRVHAVIVSVNTLPVLIVFVVVCCCCLLTFSLGHPVAAAVVRRTTAAAGPLPLPPCRLCGPTGCTRVTDFVEFFARFDSLFVRHLEILPPPISIFVNLPVL